MCRVIWSLSREAIRTLLTGGDLRSIGRANEVVAILRAQPARFEDVIRLLRDGDDPVVRMRAADAAEKASRLDPLLIQPYKRDLLALLAESVQKEIRWHLAQMIPRLRLTAAELRSATRSLQLYLTDRSSIVKTCAMQALSDLALQNRNRIGRLGIAITDQIRILARTGTPAMRARGKILLRKLEV